MVASRKNWVAHVWFHTECTIADYRAFFVRPKLCIKKALILPGNAHMAEVIDLLARGTGSLEEFQLECDQIPEVKFDALVENNQQLRSVEIQFPVDSKSSRTARYAMVEGLGAQVFVHRRWTQR